MSEVIFIKDVPYKYQKKVYYVKHYWLTIYNSKNS